MPLEQRKRNTSLVSFICVMIDVCNENESESSRCVAASSPRGNGTLLRKLWKIKRHVRRCFFFFVVVEKKKTNKKSFVFMASKQLVEMTIEKSPTKRVTNPSVPLRLAVIFTILLFTFYNIQCCLSFKLDELH